MNTARQPDFSPNVPSRDTLARGQVLEASAQEILISSSSGLVQAHVAVSCLIRPQAGDEVLFHQDDGAAFILAVLSRSQASQEAELDLPARTRLKSGHLTLDSSSLVAKADQTQINTNKLKLRGTLLTLNFSILHLAGRIFTSVFRSFFNRSKELNLEIDDSAAINADRLRFMAQEDFVAKGGNLSLEAQDSVKIDGRSLRLG
jgi:hypothetical protein